jgi:replicative DNA helicase
MDYDTNPFKKDRVFGDNQRPAEPQAEYKPPFPPKVEQQPFQSSPPFPRTENKPPFPKAEQQPFQAPQAESKSTFPPQQRFQPSEPLPPPTEQSLSARPNALFSYLKNSFSADLSQYSYFSNRKTGFGSLDVESGLLYPGLYVLGAASSMGKTTFVHQLADQLAGRGEQVIFFSLVQSRYELIIKSLSRLIAQKNGGGGGITELEIQLMKSPSSEVQSALDSYTSLIGDRLSIIDGREELNVEKIAGIVRRYITDNKARPVVIVDNMQQLVMKDASGVNGVNPAKYNLHSLKSLQQTEHLTLIVVSNIDTDSYFRHIDFDSFLNAGGVEYTADVIWGLQIQAARETEKALTKIDARERFISAKTKMPRKMELVCLKNNFGKSVYTCYFDYYPQYNLFMEEKRVEVEKVVVERL